MALLHVFGAALMYEAFGALLGHAVVHDVLASGLKTGGCIYHESFTVISPQGTGPNRFSLATAPDMACDLSYLSWHLASALRTLFDLLLRELGTPPAPQCIEGRTAEALQCRGRHLAGSACRTLPL